MGQNPHLGLPLHGAYSVKRQWWCRELALSPYVALAGICTAAVLLRFALLGHNSLWFDEAFTNYVTQMSWPVMFSQLKLTDAHPPFYYLLMKLWLSRAGDGPIALRIPSACFSALSVVLTYILARRVASESVSLLAALLVSVSPIAIMSGQEARMYPLLGLLALASTLALAACVERGGAIRWMGYVTLAALMAYTHYLGIFVIGAQGLWIACFERRQVLKWLIAGAAITALYAPWIPSLWFQTVHGHGWAWYRVHVTYQALGDLLALFAFGGSLFGSASYFSGGTLPPIEQLILLLPFLLVLWVGVTSLVSNKRSMALISLPLVLPIGLMFMISLVSPMFYPRWFSFLCPFYAILLACGIFAIAERFRGRRDRVVAFVTIGLLLYSLPVLGRYYLDPSFRLYNWRAAAALVEKQVKPGDFFLYDNSAAEITFSYYFRQQHRSLTLSPIEAVAGRDRHPTFTTASVRRLAGEYPRMWVVATVPFTPEMQKRLQSDLEASYRLVGTRDFKDVWITLLEAKNIRSP